MPEKMSVSIVAIATMSFSVASPLALLPSGLYDGSEA